jgi:hypothetical protein
MFLRAGFNPQHRLVCHAKIARRGIWRAMLIAFENGGDLAWYSKEGHFVVWAEQGHVCNLIGDEICSSNYWHDRPCSPWPRQASRRAA